MEETFALTAKVGLFYALINDDLKNTLVDSFTRTFMVSQWCAAIAGGAK